MATELVSVIVPVYNVEDYLDRCIGSVVSQTYHNLELILVDDGSPDRCPEICDNWTRKDARIKVIHKPNGGVSSARNAGLEEARGEWVFFLDADDFLPETALECLVERARKYHADVVCGSFHMIKTRNRHDYKTYQDMVLHRADFANQLPFLMNELYPTSCGKLFKTRVIREHQISFPMGIPRGEDATFHFRYMAHVECLATTEQCVYHYDLTRENSATKRYYENHIQLESHLFGIEKGFLQSIEGDHAELLKKMEQDHFVECLLNYALYETDSKIRARKIQEAATCFPESANHPLYGGAVRKKNWTLAARQWQRQNFRWYMKVLLQRFGALLR